MSADEAMNARIQGYYQAGLIGGIVGLAGCALGGFLDTTHAFQSYLFAYLFWAGLAVGCLSISMISHLTGGLWGLVIRRFLEAGTRNLPLVAILFLPMAFGLPRVYPWAEPSRVAADAVLQRKSLYLNPPFFLARAAFYLVAWNLLAFLLNKWSRALDLGPDLRTARRLRGLGGLGLVLLGLTITFSSIDWAMSLDPHWASTIYGVLFMVGQVLSAMSLMIVCIAVLGGTRPLSDVVRPGAVHDLGKLLLAFVMLWTYMHLSQFLIMWSGNLPEEIPFYLRRTQGGWQYVGLALVIFHFALPFLLLLSRDLKRDQKLLGWVAGTLFVMHIVETYWLVAPEFRLHDGAMTRFALGWLDISAILGVGGVWIAGFARQLQRRSVVATGEPEIRELLEQAQGAQ